MEDLYQRQTSNIFPGLDNETMNALNASEQNWNSTFKNGTLKQGLPSAGVKVAAAVDFTAHTPQLVSYVTSYITESVMSYLSKAITDMLSIDIGQIQSYATSLMPNFLLSPGVIMKELLTPKESIMEETTKVSDLNFINDINKNIGSHVSKLSYSINGKLSKVSKSIEDISYYSSMGPMWMKNKIDVESNKIIESCHKEIAQKRDTVKTNIQKQINIAGEKLGQRLANKVNNKTKEGTKEQLDKINIQKQKAMNKAKTAIIDAKLKLMALIGG